MFRLFGKLFRLFGKRAYGSFDAEALRVMGLAFEAACSGRSSLSKNDLEIVADRIVSEARNGERDLFRLRDAGRAALRRV